jgi:hypothetical protein
VSADDGEHGVTAVVGHAGIDDAAVENPVAIEIEKPLAGAGTEYANLCGQRMGCGWLVLRWILTAVSLDARSVRRSCP